MMSFSLVLVILILLFPSSPLSSVYSLRLLAPMKSKIVPNGSNRRLYMVFDFFKKRSEEGLQQIQNIATKTLDGKLLEALQDSSDYIKMRQKTDMESLKRLTDGLARSRDKLLGGINGVFSDEKLDVKIQLDKLEEVLLQSDIGVATTSQIISDLAAYARTQGLEQSMILPVLRSRLIESLTKAEEPSMDISTPKVIFVIGANGMGKTTSIGKLAWRLRNEFNQSVLLGACDTFRAAAVEQLGEWAVRSNSNIEIPFESERGSSPVSVVTRTLQRAKHDNFDVVIIDTSGRLSNNFELVEELKAMRAAIQREVPTAPHETLLVVDGSVGRNAVEQARAWSKYVGVSGLVVTKMDGTARGGFVVSVVKDLGIPIKFIGVGEKLDDLREFNPETFVDALLGTDAKTAEMLKEQANVILKTSSTLDSKSVGSTSGSFSSTLYDSFKNNESMTATTKGSNQQNKKKRRKK